MSETSLISQVRVKCSAIYVKHPILYNRNVGRPVYYYCSVPQTSAMPMYQSLIYRYRQSLSINTHTKMMRGQEMKRKVAHCDGLALQSQAQEDDFYYKCQLFSQPFESRNSQNKKSPWHLLSPLFLHHCVRMSVITSRSQGQRVRVR